jgi:hypothetical protein
MKKLTTVMNVSKLLLGLAGALTIAIAQAQTEMTCPNGLPADATCYNGKDENGAFYFILTAKDLEERLNECTGIRLPGAQRSDQQKQNLANILNVTRTPERTLIINMDRATFLFQDIVHRRLDGRNPFPNEGVQYTGSTDDAGLNRGVARFKTDPKAVAELADDADPTGKVTIPTVTMHAVDDPQVPVEVDAMYREIRDQAGSGEKLVQTFTDEHVHPKLGTPQYAALLAALREWMDAGHKPTPQSISDSCGKFADVYREPCRFLPEYQPKSFWSRAYRRAQ